MLHHELSLKCKNFGCFGNEPQGFERIKRVNVIIGRNNAGKSTLLDLVERATNGNALIPRSKEGRPEEVIFSHVLTRDICRAHLNNDTATVSFGNEKASVSPLSWSDDNLTRSSSRVTVASVKGGEPKCIELGKFAFDQSLRGAQAERVGRQLASKLKNPLTGYLFRRVGAERHIRPEAINRALVIESNGDGVAASIANFLINAKYDHTVIEKTLLKELNIIFEPDATFVRIVPKLVAGDLYELFIEEQGKELVAFSNMGSGLKTIIQVLANIILLPLTLKDAPKLDKFVFGFEELENNLHPAIQRRLFRYLRNRAVADGFLLFVTTHSNVVIDQFADDPEAQIVHIFRDGDRPTVKSISCERESALILDDLDVRASDLLQANVVIWVEGPSDRIFVNRWIELWSDSQLVEGVHYQCLPYGGSVGSHFSFDDPKDAANLISCLKINRHAILLIDRDRAHAETGLKKNAQRLIDEVNKTGGYGWVTAGREVENYVTPAAWKLVLGDESAEPDIYEHLLHTLAKARGVKEVKKVDFASQVVPLLERPDLVARLDLGKELDIVCQRIRQWNQIEFL